MVIETHGSNRDHDQEKLELFLEYLMENEMIVNGTVAEDSKKVGEIWQLRERMAEALQHDGYVYKVCWTHDSKYNSHDSENIILVRNHLNSCVDFWLFLARRVSNADNGGNKPDSSKKVQEAPRGTLSRI